MIIGFVLLISIALGSAVFAEEKQATGKPAAGGDKPEKAKKNEVVKKFSGKVVSVDAAAKTIVARRMKTDMTFDVAGAKFASNTKLENIKADDKIAIKYIEKDGRNVARDIAKAPSKGKN
jgi:phosphoribosylformylglycinamidine (FGAM) synthase-like amidotransferase family enzyme